MGYVEDNKGYLTASKGKANKKCPETAHKKYELGEIPDEESKSLELGTLFDEWVTLGSDAFWKKYKIKEKMLKADLILALQKSGKEFDPKANVGVLEAVYYGDAELLTPAEGEKIIQLVMMAEKQGYFMDVNNEYDVQVKYLAEYEGVKIKGTFDRLSKDGKILRDTKTCKDQKYWRAIDDYDYIFSMAWYSILVKVETGSFPEKVILDFFTTGKKCHYIPVEIPMEKIMETIEDVKKVIKQYAAYQKAGHYPSCVELHGAMDNRFLKCPEPEHCSGCIVTEPIIFQEFETDRI